MKRYLYAYGTLRPNDGKHEIVHIPGILYNLPNRGYPAAKAIGENIPERIVCEKVPIQGPRHLQQLDNYEGYMPDDPERSLYIRKEYLDGYVYEYVPPVDPLLKIQTGNWYKQAEGDA